MTVFFNMIKVGPVEVNEFIAVYAGLVTTLLVCAPINQFNEVVALSPAIHGLSKVFVNWGYLWCAGFYLVLGELLVTLWGAFFVNGIVAFLLNWWCVGAPVFDRFNEATGGFCDGNTTIHDTYQCKQAGLQWQDGVDISSHCFLLGQYIILLTFILVSTISPPRDRDLEQNVPGISQVAPQMIRAGAWLVTGCFFTEYLITCLFFHTFLERTVGLSLGLAAAQIVIYGQAIHKYIT